MVRTTQMLTMTIWVKAEEVHRNKEQWTEEEALMTNTIGIRPNPEEIISKDRDQVLVVDIEINLHSFIQIIII